MGVYGQGDENCARSNYASTNANEVAVAEAFGYEAAYCPPRRYADKKQRAEGCSRVLGDTAVFDKVTACPQHCGLLERAVAKERKHYEKHAF